MLRQTLMNIRDDHKRRWKFKARPIALCSTLLTLTASLMVFESTKRAVAPLTTSQTKSLRENYDSSDGAVAHGIDRRRLTSPLSNHSDSKEIYEKSPFPKVSPGDAFLPKEADMLYCQENNFVAMKLENSAVERTQKNTRPFSLTEKNFRAYHSKQCSTVEDLRDAVKYGRRVWDDEVAALPLNQREKIVSYFIPHKCDIPPLTPDRMCEVLNKFSYVIFQGDSLQRHTMQAMFAGLRNDFKRGAMFAPPYLRHLKCECDGQFSEHMGCRNYNALFGRSKPHQLGLCQNLRGEYEEQFESRYIMHASGQTGQSFDFDGIDCSRAENRGVLLFVNGGIHMKFHPVETFLQLIQPLFRHKEFQICNQLNKLTVIWGAAQAQSPILDRKYPEQALSHVLRFNNATEAYLRKIGKNHGLEAHIIDWTNFTIGAQKSDGVHLLEEGNIFKVYHLLNLIDLLGDVGGPMVASSAKLGETGWPVVT